MKGARGFQSYKPLSLLTKGKLTWFVSLCPVLSRATSPTIFFSHSTDDINTTVVLKGTFCFRIKQKALNSSRVKILASFGPATNTGPLIPWGPLGVILNLAYLLKFMPANFSNQSNVILVTIHIFISLNCSELQVAQRHIVQYETKTFLLKWQIIQF